MAIHSLKTWPVHFQDVWSGYKRFEVRKDDRDPRFAVGDTLILKEYVPEWDAYSGREMSVDVTYILRPPIEGVDCLSEGHCIMSIRVLDRGTIRKWTGVQEHADFRKIEDSTENPIAMTDDFA
jgi:hypothetical protein